MCNAKQQLERALRAALAQYAETMGEAFPIAPILDVIDDPEFWAVAEMHNDTFHIQVSTGTADSASALWASAFSDEDFQSGFERAVGFDATSMIHLGLVWLMLHELHHYQMGHFEDHDPTQSSKIDALDGHGLIRRAPKNPRTHPLGDAETSLIFEMQADHDATEMLLDAYSPDEWAVLRARISAISAMMMLIERADVSNHTPQTTHPKASTRIFQLLGHVMDMPTLAAHPEISLTSRGVRHRKNIQAKKELEGFSAHVVVPAFFDAVSLASNATAHSITNDLGSATDFFQDIQTAKLVQDAGASEFVTAGARQWAKLARLNGQTSS